MSDIRTDNDFFFGTNGVVVGNMITINITTKEQGYRTAAWIKIMCEQLPSEGDGTTSYDEIEQAILNT